MSLVTLKYNGAAGTIGALKKLAGVNMLKAVFEPSEIVEIEGDLLPLLFPDPTASNVGTGSGNTWQVIASAGTLARVLAAATPTGQMPLADLKGAVLTATTHATAGTTVNVAHTLGATPVGAVVITGDGYITAVDATNVTIASRGISQSLVIKVLA